LPNGSRYPTADFFAEYIWKSFPSTKRTPHRAGPTSQTPYQILVLTRPRRACAPLRPAIAVVASHGLRRGHGGHLRGSLRRGRPHASSAAPLRCHLVPKKCCPTFLKMLNVDKKIVEETNISGKYWNIFN
jgi:hypothetical protein